VVSGLVTELGRVVGREGWLAFLSADRTSDPGGAMITCRAVAKTYVVRERAGLPARICVSCPLPLR